MDNITTGIWTLIAAIVLSCTFQSIMVWTHQAADMAPCNVGTGVKETKAGGAQTCKRPEYAIPEYRVVDKTDRTPTGFATDISDSVSPYAERSEFPNTSF